jgi:hypothetical protein
MGPVIEQGTHFWYVDRWYGLQRLLTVAVISHVTSVVTSTSTLLCEPAAACALLPTNIISAHSVEWYEKPGQLSKIPIDESKIPEEERIPRLTSATWLVQSLSKIAAADQSAGSTKTALSAHSHTLSRFRVTRTHASSRCTRTVTR